MNKLYIFLIVFSLILLFTGTIILILYLSGQLNLNKPKVALKYGDYVKIKNSTDGYYWSAQPTNETPWIYGSISGDESKFLILDSSGNRSGKNVLNGDMIQIKVNDDKIVRYPLINHAFIDCAPFWGNYTANQYIPQDIIDKLEGEYSENLFQIKTTDNSNIINTETPISILQNKNRMCGSKALVESPGPAPTCSNPDVNNKFMFLTQLDDEYYVDNCNYGGDTGNCSLCEKNKMNWILEKV